MASSSKKKLIEVALPLDAINKAAAKENNVHTGLPSNLHTWWSRKPLGIARAMIFCSLVDDPCDLSSSQDIEAKRSYLLSLAARLADMDNSDDEILLSEAKREIVASVGEMSRFWDPFCGGGALPLEALRLGLSPIAADLNPVAVFITRVLIDLAPKYAFRRPINPSDGTHFLEGGAKFEGLKKDVEHYANAIHKKLVERLQEFYPSADIPKKLGGGKGDVAAWIWARVVQCPNPSCRAQAPLVNKFVLSTHKGNEAHAVPLYNSDTKSFSFTVQQSGSAPAGTVTRTGAKCLACNDPIAFEHVRSEGVAGRLGYELMALAVEGRLKRLYLSPTEAHRRSAFACVPTWVPETELPESALGFRVQRYGIVKHKDLFTNRQLTSLATLSDAIVEMGEEIRRDAKDDIAYGNLIQSFLALSLSRVAQTNNALVRLFVRTSGTSKGTPAFDRPIVSMAWEFSEGNILGSSVGSWKAAVKNPLTALASVPSTNIPAQAILRDATTPWHNNERFVVSTDPPYFDAIGYADLSDFFYIWLRRAIGSTFPDIFGTMLAPKAGDLTRDLGRRDVTKTRASQQFLERLHKAFSAVRNSIRDDIPVTVYYAFKQAEVELSSDTDYEADAPPSTGWETLLEGLFTSGFQISGTWPLRTESANRLRAIGSNALASSIVLVCRPRPIGAPVRTRRQFLNELKEELPNALRYLQECNIAPVDLAQAAIGPGMAVYTKYSQVLDADGRTLSIRDALALINLALDETLASQEGDFDSDSRWALAWFEQSGFTEGEYGVAEILSKAKNTSVSGLVHAGFLVSKAGKVRLLRPNELAESWDPSTDTRLSSWEVVHHLIRVLDAGGESAAASLVAKLGAHAEVARELAYRLYTMCERKKRATEALAYNGLVQSWPEIVRLVREARSIPMDQAELPL